MQSQSERLGTEKVGKLLFALSTPAMIGMLVTALYNIADAVYIGRGVGTLGLAGVSIAFPVQMILMAFAGAVGMGGASLISRQLGAGLRDEADKTLGNVISMALLISALAVVCGLVFVEPILLLFGSTEKILPYAKDYLSIILGGSVFFCLTMSSNNIVRAEGNARTAMYTMIISAFINVILDPVFIFGLHMGLRGAALSTVISQATAAVYMIYYFFSGKSTLSISWNNLIPKLFIIKGILTIGTVVFVRQVAGSISFILVNKMLAIYGGDVSVAVYGVVNRLLRLAFMPMMGVVQGMQPIVGYNYGAKKMHRVNETLNLAVKSTTVIGIIGFILMMAFPSYLIRIFSTDTVLIDGGTLALRIIFAAAFLIGAQMVAGGFYQALGKARQALILSMARQILFLIPLLLMLSAVWGLLGIWIAFPTSDLLAFVITALIFIRDKKRGVFAVEKEEGWHDFINIKDGLLES